MIKTETIKKEIYKRNVKNLDFKALEKMVEMVETIMNEERKAGVYEFELGELYAALVDEYFARKRG